MVRAEEQKAKEGEIGFAHFAIPSGAFGGLRRLPTQHSSRTMITPEGDGPQAHEVRDNRLARAACLIAEVVLASGGFVVLENPLGSLLFRLPCVVPLVEKYGLKSITPDMCCRGLHAPDGGSIRKPTTLLTN